MKILWICGLLGCFSQGHAAAPSVPEPQALAQLEAQSNQPIVDPLKSAFAPALQQAEKDSQENVAETALLVVAEKKSQQNVAETKALKQAEAKHSISTPQALKEAEQETQTLIQDPPPLQKGR